MIRFEDFKDPNVTLKVGSVASYYTLKNDTSLFLGVRGQPCFREVSGKSIKLGDTLTVFINCDTQTLLEGNSNNVCFLPIHLLRKHLSYLKKLFDISIKVSEVTFLERSVYKVEIRFNEKLSSIKFKFIYHWIRFSYEWDINFIIFDLYRLKQLDPKFDFDLLPLITYSASLLIHVNKFNIGYISSKQALLDLLRTESQISNLYQWDRKAIPLLPKLMPNRTPKYIFSIEELNKRKIKYLNIYNNLRHA